MESTAAGYSQSKCVMNHARYVEPASCIHIQFGRVAQGRVPQIDLSSLTYTIHRSFASSCKQDRVVVVCHANTLRSGHGFSTYYFPRRTLIRLAERLFYIALPLRLRLRCSKPCPPRSLRLRYSGSRACRHAPFLAMLDMTDAVFPPKISTAELMLFNCFCSFDASFFNADTISIL